ncbi:MAG: DUF5046 domain-containing protein [Faecalibacterium sp.]
MEDGQLRILDPQTDAAGPTILCGGKVLYQASFVERLTLVTDTLTGQPEFWLRSWPDDTAPLGRRTTLYDRNGAALLTFDTEASAGCTGSLLLVSENTTLDFSEGSGFTNRCRVFDLTTSEELPVPENAFACVAAGEVLAFTCYDMPADIENPWEEFNPYLHCRVVLQNRDGIFLGEETACYASALPMGTGPDGSQTFWLELMYSSADSYEFTNCLYDPVTGQTLDNFKQICGGQNGLVCLSTSDGQYELVDLSNPSQPVLGVYDIPVEYALPGLRVFWRQTDSYYFELLDEASGTREPLAAICYGAAGDPLAVCTSSGRLLLYDGTTGTLQLDVELGLAEDMLDRSSLQILSEGYVLLTMYDESYATSSCRIYGPEGLLYDSSQSSDTSKYIYYTSLTNTSAGPLLAGCYQGPGNAFLYDVLDCRGQVLLRGLGNCSAAYNGSFPPDCFAARRGYDYGWMDHTGRWLYCQSIFSSLSAEEGIVYYW